MTEPVPTSDAALNADLGELVGRPVLIVPFDDSDRRYIAWILRVDADNYEIVMERRPAFFGD